MTQMQYTQLPYVAKPVSKIFFGTAREEFMQGQDASELFEAAFATGINAIDTARHYQDAEVSLGKWLRRRGRRDDLVILSKCAHPSADGSPRVTPDVMWEELATSCEALGTDYIDMYLLHRDDPDAPVGPLVETFNAMHAQGRIGAFGGSNWTHTRLQQANEYARNKELLPFTVSSPYFGLADQLGDPWGATVSIAGPTNSEARTWHATEKLAVVAYSSLGRGLFSGRVQSNRPAEASAVLDRFAMKGYGYEENFRRLERAEALAEKHQVSVAQVAMAWLFAQAMQVFAVVSTTNAARIQENVAALGLKLSESLPSGLNSQNRSLPTWTCASRPGMALSSRALSSTGCRHGAEFHAHSHKLTNDCRLSALQL